MDNPFSFLKRWFDQLNETSSHLLAGFGRRLPRTAKFFGILRQRRRPIFVLTHVVLHIVGFFLSVQAVMQTRTEQGAIAWALSLNTIPIIAVPAWFVFGDSNIDSYITTRRAGLAETRPVAETLIKNLSSAEIPASDTHPTMAILGRLASMPTTTGNHAELLIDGEQTYTSMLEAMQQAKDYILFQTYIFRGDDTGNRFKDTMMRKAREGVDVYLLIDNFGSLDLANAFLKDLREAGVHVRFFMDLTGDTNRFQLNFRNHRKLTIVDGKSAFLGGCNIGDEYLGEHDILTPWRDVHVKLTGPVVKCAQVPFTEDWHWATGEIPADLNWDIAGDGAAGDMEAVCIPSGPSDPLETCSLFFLTAINNAKKRVWIATPYFVPDDKMVTALQLAALRGVDVKVIIPEIVDSKLAYYSSFSYIDQLDGTGVSISRYKGFSHHKVVLIDDDISAIGSANFDNRSFRLNFELTGVIHDPGFNAEVAKMLEQDLTETDKVTAAELEGKPFYFRVLVRLARLLAPLQ